MACQNPNINPIGSNGSFGIKMILSGEFSRYCKYSFEGIPRGIELINIRDMKHDKLVFTGITARIKFTDTWDMEKGDLIYFTAWHPSQNRKRFHKLKKLSINHVVRGENS